MGEGRGRRLGTSEGAPDGRPSAASMIRRTKRGPRCLDIVDRPLRTLDADLSVLGLGHMQGDAACSNSISRLHPYCLRLDWSCASFRLRLYFNSITEARPRQIAAKSYRPDSSRRSALVGQLHSNVGYRCRSLVRASAVVNCQCTG